MAPSLPPANMYTLAHANTLSMTELSKALCKPVVPRSPCRPWLGRAREGAVPWACVPQHRSPLRAPTSTLRHPVHQLPYTIAVRSLLVWRSTGRLRMVLVVIVSADKHDKCLIWRSRAPHTVLHHTLTYGSGEMHMCRMSVKALG